MNKNGKLIMLVACAILISTIAAATQTFGQNSVSESTNGNMQGGIIVQTTDEKAPSQQSIAGVPLQLRPFKNYTNASYVTDGIGVRNTGRGTINLRLPNKATLKDAWLYWMILNNVNGVHDNEISVNGIKVKGTKIGSGPTPCWSGNGTSYRANINSALSTTGALGGGAFGITIGDMNTSITSGVGQNEGFSLPAAEYAGIVIVYTDPNNPTSYVTIYDGYFEQSGGIASFPVPAGARMFSSLIGDGQVAFGQNSVNYNHSGITTTLQQNTLTGADPSIMSRATTQGSLADTDTFILPSEAIVGDTLTWDQASDCLSYEALVFSSANP